jgi:hypothetical protein
MGVAAMDLDFYDDTGHELLAKVAMPAGLKGVPLDLLSEAGRERLDARAFGLVVITKQGSVVRKFPVSDPGNAWLSAQYFDANCEKLAFPARFIAARQIRRACAAYGVPTAPRVEKYAAHAPAGPEHGNTFVEGSESGWMLRKLAERELASKEATARELDALLGMPDGHFALVVHTGDGEVIRKYAMPDAAHVKTAAAYFDKYAMQFAPEHRHRFACSVKHRAAELGVDVGGSRLLDKWASESWNPHVGAHLEQRRSLLPFDRGAQAALDKLASFVGQTDPETLARALETFDASTGLTRYYDRGLTDAYASTLDKQASAWSAEVDGHTLTESDLKKAESKLRRYFGESFAAQFAKSPVEIFESLPETERVLIKQMATGEA